jgi:hypothetical protein
MPEPAPHPRFAWPPFVRPPIVRTQPPEYVPADWAAMAAAEPMLLAIEANARRNRLTYCNFWQQYERLKRLLKALVGWYCRRPELSTSAHYNVAIDRIIAVLWRRREEGIPEQ